MGTVLVTAAFGHQGRQLVPKLVARGHWVRAIRSSAGGEDDLRRLGAHDVMIGDLADVETYKRALDGMDAVYHVGPATHPSEREMGFAMVEAALHAGTRHVVMSSVQHTMIDILQHRIKRDIEEELIKSGLNYTIIKPGTFMMNAMYFTPIMQHGEYQVYWTNKPGRRLTLIDVNDLTEAVARVIDQGAKHYFASYELAGPDKLTVDDIARIASKVIGREIKVAQKGPLDLLRIISGSAEVTEKNQRAYDIMISGGKWHSQHDFVGNPGVLEWLIGRPALTFEAYFEQAYDAYRKSGAAAGGGASAHPAATGS